MVALDITEINTPSRLILAVDDKYQYTDLDELIVNHVQVIMCKVKELMAHKKFKCGPKDELYLSLKNFVAANPAKSAYGFMLNCQKPAHFNLCFLANKNATVQNWPMHVTPESYCLFEAPVTGIPELCDAFKTSSPVTKPHKHGCQRENSIWHWGLYTSMNPRIHDAWAVAKPQLHHLLMEVASLVLAMGCQVNPLLVI
ncbi:SH2 domain-containing protein [Pisolithus sp. B1]|nr:SH2 domain-containing protein [Pisolithus sp. B1]